ncbi:hypothetical protein CRYUN_Cryun03dG0040300 [Craigia yunnanensis]
MTFSLHTAADIANVLYGHLKLPVLEGRNKGKQHPSTDKLFGSTEGFLKCPKDISNCLCIRASKSNYSRDADFIVIWIWFCFRDEHPIIPVIREHRTLAKLLNCTLGSICSLARLSRSTHKYTLHGCWLQTSTATGLLSMEEPNLQCVEHMVEFSLSKDKNGSDANVDHYKINVRDLFFLLRYVETLKGRERFLSKIKFGNSKEKSQDQRQAVNSICQGSAADIIKIAMTKMYSVIIEGVDRLDSGSSISTKFHMLKGRCRILLQVHDELVPEVDPSMIKEAAWLLRMSMENALSSRQISRCPCSSLWITVTANIDGNEEHVKENIFHGGDWLSGLLGWNCATRSLQLFSCHHPEEVL